MTEHSPLYLEDLAIGDEFRSGEHLLDANQITGFAQQFDPQPFHLDPDAAKDTFFQGLAASGWHTAAITMKLLVSSLPLSGGLIGAGGELEWPRPTRPGDILHVEIKILDIRPLHSKPDRGMVTVEVHTVNQHDETRQKMTAKLIALRRPPASPSASRL